MDEIVVKIQNLAGNADAVGRLQIQNALRQVLIELENPQDSLTQLLNAYLQIAIFRVGVQSGIFRLFSQSETPLQVTELAELSNASAQMLERIVRFLASNGIIDEVGQGIFQANKLTHFLSSQGAEAFIYYGFDCLGPAIQALPGFLTETGYADITSNTNTPFQKGFNTDLPCFEWLAQHPKMFSAMQQVMTAFRSSDWISGFDIFEKEAAGVPSIPPKSSEPPFFVDVGGGRGHQSIQVRDKYPNLNGRLVLQDLAEAVNELPEIEGVKALAHDFFQKQPIKGAKFYYLRRIMHDYPDAQCVTILQNLKSAMTHDSRILIDELVLPDTKVPWQAAMFDLSMMVHLGGKERSSGQWRALAEQSGLRVTDIHPYNAVTFGSVVVLQL